jgi:hypothetical protein
MKVLTKFAFSVCEIYILIFFSVCQVLHKRECYPLRADSVHVTERKFLNLEAASVKYFQVG